MKFRYLIMSLCAAATLAVGCQKEEDDLLLPKITVSGSGLTFDDATKRATLSAGEEMSSYTTSLTANRPWTIDITYGTGDKDWIVATPDHGEASDRQQEVVFTLLANEGRDRSATVKYNIGYDYKTVVIKQKGSLGSIEDATLYANNFDKEVATQTFGSGSSWPFLDQFDGWQNESGVGASGVTYSYSGMSVRNNSNSNGSYSDYDGSGSNNLFFGTSAYVTVEKIDISASNQLRLTFGTEKYLGSGDSTFNPAEFTVSLSGNGTDWSKPIAYSFAGEFKSGRWDLATADFTVPEDVKTLYIRFAASVASAYRLDDVTLTIGDGGDLIELTGGSDNPGGDNPGGGDQPSGDAIYGNNFDKEAAEQTFGSGSSWPFLDQFDGWQNESGVGASGVTYSYTGMSARNNSNSNGSYSDYAGSGLNNLFFGASAYFTIEKIDISSSNKLHLTFGTEKYLGSGDSTFNPAEFTVTLSGDGESWSAPIAYSFPNGNKSGRWDLATADFTVPENVKTLYIKFAASVASAYRLDDVTLAPGNGGTFIDLTAGGSTGGDNPGGDQPVGEEVYGNNFDKETATQTFGSGSSWPFLDQFDGWQNQKGTGASGVSYSYSGTSARNNSNSNGSYSDYAGSGLNNIFFGTSAYFTIEKIDISSSNKLRLTFGTEKYLGSGDSTFNPAEFTVTLSGDGESWSAPIAYSFPNGNKSGRWDLATADFTVPENVKTLYIKFTATVASAYRLDDVSLTTGNGGTLIDLTAGGSTGGDNPGGGDQPSDPTDVKTVTVAQFNAAPESDTQVYELTGTISGSINVTYGNFDLVDETGSVYVYGLTATNLGYGAKNDNTYGSLGLNAGDKIKIRGYRGSYNGKIEVMYAWFIEKLGSTGGGTTDPGTDPNPGTGSKFESDAAFVCSADDSANSSYTLKASTFNGQAASGFKLGTGSKVGKFTSAPVNVTGDCTLSLYGVAWKGSNGTLKVSVVGGGSVDGTDTYNLKSNDGATGNPAFTITVDETADHYEFPLKGLTASSTIVFETVGTAYRVIVAGVHLEVNNK